MNQAPSLSSCIFYSIIRRLCKFCFISLLHMPHSPPGVFLFRTVHLASLPFLSPRCVPPALLRSAVFVTSAVHICWLSLSPPRHPLLLGHRVSLRFTPAFLPGGPSASQKRNNFAMASAPVFMLPAPLHRSRGTHVAPVVQLIGSEGKDGSAAA